MEETTDEKILRIFRRAVARSLGALDIIDAAPEVKQAIKNTIWDCSREIMDAVAEIKKGADDGRKYQ